MKPIHWILIAGIIVLILILVLVFVGKGQTGKGQGDGKKKDWCFKDGDKKAKAKCLSSGGQIDKWFSKCGAFKNRCFYV